MATVNTSGVVFFNSLRTVFDTSGSGTMFFSDFYSNSSKRLTAGLSTVPPTGQMLTVTPFRGQAKLPTIVAVNTQLVTSRTVNLNWTAAGPYAHAIITGLPGGSISPQQSGTSYVATDLPENTTFTFTITPSSGTPGVRYPPVPLTGASTTISGQAHGNGTYTVSSSSFLNTGWEPWRAFRSFTDYGNLPLWYSGNNFNYIANTGIYGGSVITLDTNSTEHRGEWLQIQLPSPIRLTHHIIIGRTNGTSVWRSNTPRTFTLFASNNGSTWTPIQDITDYNITHPTCIHATGFIQPASDQTYTYFRLVVKAVGNQGVTGLIGNAPDRTSINMFWQIFGTTAAIGTTGAPLTITRTTATEETVRFPSNVMTSNSTVVSGQLYANGTYTASASTNYTEASVTWDAWQAFRTFTDYASGPCWHSAIIYNATSGAYTGNLRTTDTLGTDHWGEWIQIVFPVSMRLRNHVIVARPNSGFDINRTPTSFTLLASNNGTNWFPIQDVSNFTITGQISQHNVIDNLISYTHYRLVVKAVGNPGATSRNSVQMFWRLNGIPVLRLPSNVLTDNSTTLSNQTYGNGTYNVSASTFYGAGYEPWRAFRTFTDYTSVDAMWHSVHGVYNGSSGAYAGIIETLDANGTSHLGEWLQIVLPTAVCVKSHIVIGRAHVNFWRTRTPRTFTLLASNTGANGSWLPIQDVVNFSITAQSHTHSNGFIEPANLGKYTHFRIVVKAVGDQVTAGSDRQSVQMYWVLNADW